VLQRAFSENGGGEKTRRNVLWYYRACICRLLELRASIALLKVEAESRIAQHNKRVAVVAFVARSVWQWNVAS